MYVVVWVWVCLCVRPYAFIPKQMAINVCCISKMYIKRVEWERKQHTTTNNKQENRNKKKSSEMQIHNSLRAHHTPDRDRASVSASGRASNSQSQPETANSVVELLVCVVRQLDQTLCHTEERARERTLSLSLTHTIKTEQRTHIHTHNERTNEPNQPTNERMNIK